jgi:hypothetical protein
MQKRKCDVCDSEMLDMIAAYIARGIITICECQNKKVRGRAKNLREEIEKLGLLHFVKPSARQSNQRLLNCKIKRIYGINPNRTWGFRSSGL